MQRTIRCRVIATIIPAWLLSFAILISGAQLNVAQAQDNVKKDRVEEAVACGKQLRSQCSGVPAGENQLLICLQQSETNLSTRCAALARNVVDRCGKDAARYCKGVVAGKGNIIECLTTAKRSVSSRCNAAIDAAYLR